MLRKFLIPTVIVSILLLLTTLITIAKSEVASVVTSTTATFKTTTSTATTPLATTAVTIPIPFADTASKSTTTTTTTTSAAPRQRKITIVHAQAANPRGTRVIYHGRRKYNNTNTRNFTRRLTKSKSRNIDISNNTANNNSSTKVLLLNNAEETTTSLLPLQPTLTVTPTTLPSLILSQEQGHQQESQQQANVTQLQERQQDLQQQPQQQQLYHQHQPEHQKRQNRQPIQDVTDTTTTTTATTTQQQSDKYLINVAQTENDSQPKELSTKDSEESSADVEIVTSVPFNTNDYIPFELDYNDPTEEKSRPPEAQRKSTINEVLYSLFPKGFTDIFRFSYAPEPTEEEHPSVTIPPSTTVSAIKAIKPSYLLINPIDTFTNVTEKTTRKPAQIPITVIKSTPMPFKPKSTTAKIQENIKELLDLSVAVPFKPMPTIKSKPKITVNGNNSSADNTKIVIEQILTDQRSGKSSEEFRDGSNSINKDELLRINRAAKEASVLPSMLLMPDGDLKATNKSTASKTIVILNDSGGDDFVDAPEDDNQIAESQNIAQGVYHTPPPPESISYHRGENQNINIHIVHDDKLRKSQSEDLQKRNKELKLAEPTRNLQSYQSFVEQAKIIQNSLEEAPSRKFLKSFNPTLSRGSNNSPVSKGNFHYEQRSESHIQTVPPAAQLQYVLLHSPQQSQQQNGQREEVQEQGQNNQQYRSTHEGYYRGGGESEASQDKGNANQMHYFIQLPNYEKAEAEPNFRGGSQAVSSLHTQIIDNNQLGDKDAYQTLDGGSKKQENPLNLVFVTISPQEPPNEVHHAKQQPKYPSKAPLLGLSPPYKSPSEYVHEAINAVSDLVPDHQPEETENNPNPSHNGHNEGGEGRRGGKGGYTFVEVQKSINIHNKLITEKDGHLVEQHETIYPPPIYGERLPYKHEYHPQPPYQQREPQNYVSLSQNPIHVESQDQHEQAESLQAVQHALDPSQSLIDIGTIQQSNLVQESHLIESPTQEEQHIEVHQPYQHHDHEQYHHETQSHQEHEPHAVQEVHEEQHHHIEEQHHHIEEHHNVEEQHEHHIPPEPSQNPDQPPLQVPYAPPHPEHGMPYFHYQQPFILQEVIEKHIHIPYPVPEPVAYPVHVQQFIDRPVPVETIVEKPVPYPVEKVVEKVVEKHVPVEVEKIVEKPVEKIVKKYIDRPIAVPIKIPVALQVTTQNLPYGSYYPSTFGGNSYSNVDPWAQQPTLHRIPTKVLQAYYSKMLKKLVPQMTQAYRSSPLATKPKGAPKFVTKPKTNQSLKVGDMRYDLKPPPPPALGTSWDVGARYQYDYNTLPIDLSASSSTAVVKQSERPGTGHKTNFDEFQRWRNGHSLKRSPELGMNLHVEYGFKPPLVPSVEIDDKGVPLKAASDLTKGKDE